jgi:hypothetical protein
MKPSGPAHAAVKRELLVRLLDSTVATLHGGFTYAEGYAGAVPGQESSAVAALRVLGEFTDRLRGRISVVLVGADPERLDATSGEIARVRAELGLTARVHVEAVPGGCDEHLVAALQRADAFGSPILAYLDAAGAAPPGYATLARLAAGPHVDTLIALDRVTLSDPRGRAALSDPRGGVTPDPGDDLVTCYRETLGHAGLPRVAHVELVDDEGRGQLLFFATASASRLDRFKDELWAVDEFAGVRYADPRDPDHALLDISLEPHLGPLRRALLRRVEASGGCPAGELRDYTRAETMYRAPDAFRALTALVTAGQLAREPERGRLTARTVIRPRNASSGANESSGAVHPA